MALKANGDNGRKGWQNGTQQQWVNGAGEEKGSRSDGRNAGATIAAGQNRHVGSLLPENIAYMEMTCCRGLIDLSDKGTSENIAYMEMTCCRGLIDLNDRQGTSKNSLEMGYSIQLTANQLLITKI